MTKPVSSHKERIFEDLIEQWAAESPGEDSAPVAIAMRMRHLYSIDQRSLQEVLQPFDVGFGEIDVLTRLGQQPAPYRLRPSDLAEMCMVTTGAITGRISRLERGGYISRAPSSSDKRTVFVEMTESGRTLLQQTRDKVDRASRFMNGIRALSSREQEQLNRTLMKLIRILGE